MNLPKQMLAAGLIIISFSGCARQPEITADAHTAGSPAPDSSAAAKGQGVPTIVLVAAAGTLALIYLLASAAATASLMDGPS